MEKLSISGVAYRKREGIALLSSEFFKSALVHWLLIAFVFLNVANWVVLGIFVRPVDFPVYLHYNIYLGIDQSMVGRWQDIFFLPVVCLLFFLVNVALAFHLHRERERIASYILLLASTMVQIAAIIASAAIILINY